MLRFGPDAGPTVIAALPLFEEANRTRAAMVDVLRRLAESGTGGALPDLPGTNDSPLPTGQARIEDWRAAFAAAAATLPGPVFAVGWRGGALIDADATVAGRWHLAPVDGPAQARELTRLRRIGGGADHAGNTLDPTFLTAVEAAPPLAAARTVRLESDALAADRKLPGRPLWRGVEPGTDAALQAAIADDIARWIATCGG